MKLHRSHLNCGDRTKPPIILATACHRYSIAWRDPQESLWPGPEDSIAPELVFRHAKNTLPSVETRRCPVSLPDPIRIRSALLNRCIAARLNYYPLVEYHQTHGKGFIRTPPGARDCFEALASPLPHLAHTPRSTTPQQGETSTPIMVSLLSPKRHPQRKQGIKRLVSWRSPLLTNN